jgi:hypothetical protein
VAESGEAAKAPAWPERVLDESELNYAFAATSSSSDLWIAVNQLLRGAIIEATFDVSNPSNALNHGALAHAAGGLEYLGRFQRDLNDRFRAAHQGAGLL